MNWIGVAYPWINGVAAGVPMIVATTGFDPDKEICRALVYFVSPAARKVGINYYVASS